MSIQEDYMRLITIILNTCKNTVGIKETGVNEGWDNEEYQNFMRNILHHKKGDAWCVYAAIYPWLVAYSQYDSTIVDRLLKLFNPLAKGFYNNAKKAGLTIDMNPGKGDIVIWLYYIKGKATINGHAGIVIEGLSDNHFKTYEGNTNAEGGREGESTAYKVRKYITTPAKDYTGLVIHGFIKPPMV